MDNIKKLREDFEHEKANVRVNYFFNFIFVLSYIIFDKIEEIEILGDIYNAHWLTFGVFIFFLLFYFKEIILYGKFSIKKFVLGVKK